MSVFADLDGDGQIETVEGNGALAKVIKNGAVIWQHNGPIDGWNRSDDDQFYAADLDGDHHQEIVVADDKDKWTGVFKWDGEALHTIWGSPSPLKGPAGDWNPGSDLFLVADFDGDGADEVFLANNDDLWTGVLKWQNASLHPVWMSPTPVHGPAGDWVRNGTDQFLSSVNPSVWLTTLTAGPASSNGKAVHYLL
jgi:hypothetical protein